MSGLRDGDEVSCTTDNDTTILTQDILHIGNITYPFTVNGLKYEGYFSRFLYFVFDAFKRSGKVAFYI